MCCGYLLGLPPLGDCNKYEQHTTPHKIYIYREILIVTCMSEFSLVLFKLVAIEFKMI